MTKRSWNEEDRDAFRRHDILRAQTIPGRRFEGPTADEWDEDEEES